MRTKDAWVMYIWSGSEVEDLLGKFLMAVVWVGWRGWGGVVGSGNFSQIALYKGEPLGIDVPLIRSDLRPDLLQFRALDFSNRL
jgi:hypothetical protein